MKKLTAITALGLLAACGSAGAGEGQAEAQRKVDARLLTIAGVGIGMSGTAAQAALAADGWKVEIFRGRDWAVTVAEEAGRQRNAPIIDRPRTGIETIQAAKGDEKLIIDLRPVPSGAEVRFVKYEAPMAGRSVSGIASQLVKRYGPASFSSAPGAPLSMTWCSDGERCRSENGSAKPALGAREDVYHKLRLFLSGGGDGDRAWQANVQRAAGGAGAKASF